MIWTPESPGRSSCRTTEVNLRAVDAAKLVDLYDVDVTEEDPSEARAAAREDRMVEMMVELKALRAEADNRKVMSRKRR